MLDTCSTRARSSSQQLLARARGARAGARLGPVGHRARRQEREQELLDQERELVAEVLRPGILRQCLRAAELIVYGGGPPDPRPLAKLAAAEERIHRNG